MQRLVGLPDDGHMSSVVIAAVQKRGASDLITRMCDERLAFLKRLKTWPVFGAGWGRRVAEVRAAALAMAVHARPEPKTTPAVGKGVIPVKASAHTRAAGAIAAVGAAFAGWHGAAFNKGTIMGMFVLILAAALGGYVASIFTWPRLRQVLVGIDNEIDDLRARARALEARLRG